MVLFIHHFLPGSTKITALVLTPPTVLWGVIEYFRMRNPKLNQRVMWVLAPVMRKEEQTRFTGTFYFLVGVIICLVCFEDNVSVLSLVFLSWCDPMASLVGVLYGKHTIRFANGKSLAGFIAAVVTGTVATYVVYSTQIIRPVPQGMSLLVLSLGAGGIAGIAEGVSVFGLDDNLTLPLVAAVLLNIFYSGWGSLSLV